ncbi:hypothetical protein CC2G_004411 [Coprinopsis cinerea AmutBmut pab1-1]|nr:hypothetical protein CC2G_004411 [Coprinopsis cinerea AmutBmut pab1-1]
MAEVEIHRKDSTKAIINPVERTHTMPPKAGSSSAKATPRTPKTAGKKAKEQEARKQRAAEREKAKEQATAQEGGRMGSAAKGKGKAKGTKRKITSREFVDSDEGAGAGGSGSGERIDEQDGAGAGGSGSGKEGDEQETAGAGGSGSGKDVDEQDGAGAGGSGSGNTGGEQDGRGKGKQKQSAPASPSKTKRARRVSGAGGKTVRSNKKVDKAIVESESAVQTLEDMLAARADAAGPAIKFQMIASEAHMGLAMLYVGAGPIMGKDAAKFDEVDSFAQSAIYQWVKNDDERHFKGVIPFSLRQFNLRGIDQSVFDDLYNKGKELLTQSPEHAIIIALPGRIVNKEKSFPSPTSANPHKVKQLVLNLEELAKLKEENPEAVIYLVNGAHRVEVTQALMKASRESWGKLLVTASNVKDSQEKKKTLDQIRSLTQLLEQAGSWCARVYDLDKINASGHGEEVLRTLASNPDFASSPDRPLDIVENIVSVLIPHGVNHALWGKQLPYLPDHRLVTQYAKDDKTLEVVVHLFASKAHTHIKDTKLTLGFMENVADLPGTIIIPTLHTMLRATSWLAAPLSVVPQHRIRPRLCPARLQHLRPTILGSRQGKVRRIPRPSLYLFRYAPDRLPQNSALWNAALQSFYAAIIGYFEEEVNRTDEEKETGDEVANSDLIRVLPDRLRKIQASIANPEHGEWGLPIYVPQFAMRLVELLASRSEAIRMIVALIDPGFLMEVHGNSGCEYRLEDVARWIATYPPEGCTSPADLVKDDCSDAILEGIRRVVLRSMNTVLVEWTKQKSHTWEWLAPGAPIASSITKLSKKKTYKKEAQEACKYLTSILRQYAIHQANEEHKHRRQYPEIDAALKIRNGTFYPVSAKSVQGIAQKTRDEHMDYPEAWSHYYRFVEVALTRSGRPWMSPGGHSNGAHYQRAASASGAVWKILVCLPKLVEMLKADAVTFNVYRELRTTIHAHRDKWIPWHGINDADHSPTGESLEKFAKNKVTDFQHATDLESLIQYQRAEMTRYYQVLTRSFAIAYTISVEENGKHVQKTFSRIPSSSYTAYVEALRHACYMRMLERKRFTKVLMEDGNELRPGLSNLSFLDDVLPKEFGITVPKEMSDFFMDVDAVKLAIRPYSDEEKMKMLMGQGPAAPVRSSRVGVAVPIPGAPNVEVKAPEPKGKEKAAATLPAGGINLDAPDQPTPTSSSSSQPLRAKLHPMDVDGLETARKGEQEESDSDSDNDSDSDDSEDEDADADADAEDDEMDVDQD